MFHRNLNQSLVEECSGTVVPTLVLVSKPPVSHLCEGVLSRSLASFLEISINCKHILSPDVGGGYSGVHFTEIH